MQRYASFTFLLVVLVGLAACNGGRGRGSGVPMPMPDMPGEPTDPEPDPITDPEPEPITCTDECDPAGAPQCVGSGWRTCSRDADGCAVWSAPTACAAGQICEAGACRSDACPGGCCPTCDGTRCGAGSDGCGGTCECGAGMACNDIDMCCTPENGAASCNRVVTAWCARILECCTASGAPTCPSWAFSMTGCRAQHVSDGLDCSSAEWTSSSFCAEGIDRCVADIPVVSCGDIYAGTANLPSSC